ncbi:hypothetical protein HanHA300_Chr01g0022791 [Helianthus annuus]|nr:hypothetical protein HanHA300_Chr01g0022791 [Helianthus annuus]
MNRLVGLSLGCDKCPNKRKGIVLPKVNHHLARFDMPLVFSYPSNTERK